MTFRIVNAVLLLLFFCMPAFSISNSYIDCRVATATANTDDITRIQVRGAFTAANGAGQNLLYGYPDHPWSSFASLYIESPSNTTGVYGLAGAWYPAPGDSPGDTMNTTSWQWNGVNVRQEIAIVTNPAAGGNSDTLRFKYVIKNNSGSAVRAGLRVLFDTQLGINDNSPIFVQGVGRVVQETEWTGLSVPDAWYTVDDEMNPSIRAEGNLAAAGAVKPDRLIIGQFDYMDPNASRWTYTLHPQDITDTAVAVFWDPQDYTAGQERTYVTYYGIPGIAGTEMQVAKSASPSGTINYGDTVSYSISFRSADTQYPSSVYVWDTLPWNMTFVDAEAGYSFSGGVVSWNIGSITDTLDHSRWFRASVNSGQGYSVTNKASTGYTDSYWNYTESRVSALCANPVATWSPTASPTPSPTHTISPTHTVSPTATITPTFTATPEPLVLAVTGVFPNPAKVKAHIVFNLTCAAQVKVRLFTISGEAVNQQEFRYEKGNNSYNWDLKNSNGKEVVSGTYLYTLEATTDRGEKKKLAGKFFVLR